MSVAATMVKKEEYTVILTFGYEKEFEVEWSLMEGVALMFGYGKETYTTRFSLKKGFTHMRQTWMEKRGFILRENLNKEI